MVQIVKGIAAYLAKKENICPHQEAYALTVMIIVSPVCQGLTVHPVKMVTMVIYVTRNVLKIV